VLLLEQEAQHQRERQRLEQQQEAIGRMEAQKREALEREAKIRQEAAAKEKAIAEQKSREEAAARAKQEAAAKEQQLQQQQRAQEAKAIEVTSGRIPTAGRNTSIAPTSNTAPTGMDPTRQAIYENYVKLGIIASDQERLRDHTRYLDLHARLKQMRAQVLEQCKTGPIRGLKNQASDWRRSIGKCCGQLSPKNKEGNRRAMKEIESILDQAGKVNGQPMIDPTPYIVNAGGDPNALNGVGPVPGLLVYLLNILAKKIVAQLSFEAAIDHAAAEPIGVLALSIFADAKFQINGVSFFDMIWAKYHRACPVLFGITASEATEAGRKLVGWAQEDTDRGARTWVSADAHYSRQCGLAAGFAAFTLRDFSRSSKKNPVPNRLYWAAVARLVNTPPRQQIASQYAVLRALLDATFLPRFLQFFGDAALAALRTAMIDFPARATAQARADPNFNGQIKQLEAMPSMLQKDLATYL
jgi:nucleoporin GLE1